MSGNTEYVPYAQIVGRLPIKRGDILYVISDILDIAKSCRNNGEKFDCVKFIESLQVAVGEDGTLLFPTFNWDFCKGIAFDYHKTKGKTGVLGNTALKMPNFKRTQHPLYSFAVWGREKDTLAHIVNTSSFGEDSPFAYMRMKQAKAFVIGLSSLKGNSFIHYIEQSKGVKYRFDKSFTAPYIDSLGNVSTKTYTMYVRDLDLNAQYAPQAIEQMIDQLGINRCYCINEIPYHLTDIRGLYDIGILDIQYNQAKNMYQY